jgi:hypothetical protein
MARLAERSTWVPSAKVYRSKLSFSIRYGSGGGTNAFTAATVLRTGTRGPDRPNRSTVMFDTMP